MENLEKNFLPLVLHKEILELLIPLINTRSKKIKSLDSLNILISFINTRSKRRNSSTK